MHAYDLFDANRIFYVRKQANALLRQCKEEFPQPSVKLCILANAFLMEVQQWALGGNLNEDEIKWVVKKFRQFSKFHFGHLHPIYLMRPLYWFSQKDADISWDIEHACWVTADGQSLVAEPEEPVLIPTVYKLFPDVPDVNLVLNNLE